MISLGKCRSCDNNWSPDMKLFCETKNELESAFPHTIQYSNASQMTTDLKLGILRAAVSYFDLNNLRGSAGREL